MASEGAQPEMSPQEAQLLQYLEDLQASNPAEYEMLVKDLQEKAAAKGQPSGGSKSGEQVTPTPGFVAKTRSFTKKGAKVFINVCSSEHVDKPAPVEGHESQEEVQMRIPLSLGPPREDLDKNGDVCTVYDVVFHPDAVEGALKEEEFRSFVMQLTAHQIQQKHEDEISLEMSFPKLKGNYKGIAPLPQFMRKKGVPPPPPPGSKEALEAEAKAAAEAQGGAGADGAKVLVEEMAGPSIEELPAPSYAVEPRRIGAIGAAGGGVPTGGSSGAADGLAIKCHLPQVDEISSIELDVSVEAVELVVPGVCALSVQLPHKVTLPPVKASFETDRKVLTLLLKNDAVANLDGGVEADEPPEASAVMDPEVGRREREREARANARRRRAAGNKQLERQAEVDLAAKTASADGASEEGAGAAEAEVTGGAAAGAEGDGDEAVGGSAVEAAAAFANVDANVEAPRVGPVELSNSIMFELQED